MIKERLTSELRKKFSDAIERTKEYNSEHGFYMCSTDDNIIGSEIISGTDRVLNLGDPVIACKGNKVIGNFHTHNYGTLFKKTSKFMRPDMSDEDVKNYLNNEFDQYKKELGVKELTIDSPSSKDLLKSILYSCSDRSEGIMCVASDVGNNVECWTPKKIPRKVCDDSYEELYQNNQERSMVIYKNWMIPLFHRETIADAGRVRPAPAPSVRLALPARSARGHARRQP